jgi:2-succinyl-6-hydroxy-2,4-cyclohexadiene-1-carboxylate synthase
MTAAFVFLHGFSGSPAAWDPVLRELPEGTRFVAPTIAGHGGLAGPSSFEEEVERLAAVVRDARLSDVHLCGYSLGGRLAAGLLARHAALFASATLIGAHPGLGSDDERRARAAQDEEWARFIETEGVDAFVARWEAQPMFATQQRLPAEVLASQRAARASHGAAGLGAAMRGLGLARMPDYRAALLAVSESFEIDLVAGELDTKFAALARALATSIPRARLTIIADGGHNVVLERPAAIAAILRARM